MRKYLRIQRLPSSKMRHQLRAALFVRPFFPGLSQPNAGAASVVVDELDAANSKVVLSAPSFAAREIGFVSQNVAAAVLTASAWATIEGARLVKIVL